MNVEEVGNPGYEEPRKSGGRSWMACFGIGCVVLLVLCAVGAIISWFAAGDLIKMAIEQGQMHAESMQVAMENEEVNEKLGSPVELDGIPFPEVIPGDNGGQVQKYSVNLKGSSGTGVLNIEYRMTPGQPVERTVFNVEIDGEVIDLMESDGMELNIDDGMEMDEGAGEVSDETSMEEEPVGAGS